MRAVVYNPQQPPKISFRAMDVPRDYFSVHFGILKCIGIPLKPMKDTNVVLKSLYCIYSTLLLGVFPIYFSLSEFLHLFHGSSIDTITFNLSYAITHCLGKSCCVEQKPKQIF